MDMQRLFAGESAAVGRITRNLRKPRSASRSSFLSLSRVRTVNAVTPLLRNTIRSLILVLGVMAVSGNLAYAATCPAVGADTDCGVIITITDQGSKALPTGQPPYDKIEDTLIGVVNNSKVPISSLDLNSGAGVFGFDGDGIVTYGIPGNPKDSTGYGGPNAYFTNFSGAKGTVKFISPIPPGGTSYFSLELSIGAAIACTDLINKSVPKPAGGSPTITATFTPQPVNGAQYTVAEAATLCGFVDFDWVQTIIREVDPNAGLAAANLDVIPTTASVGGIIIPVHLGGKFRPKIVGPVKLGVTTTPYSDPPQGAGYAGSAPDYSYPFYCDPTGDATCARTATTLSIRDTPSTACLVDKAGNPSNAYKSNPLIRAACGNKTAKIGSSLLFITHLAGIKYDGKPFDLGIGYTWTSDYNGTAGGVSVSKNGAPPDPGSGTGGVTITSFNDTTQYQYNGISVSGVNGVAQSQTLLDTSLVNTTTSGLLFSRSNQTFSGSATITNISDSPINGPFQIVLVSLPAGVTLDNATNTFGGFPYITLPNLNSLAPGQSSTVILQFKNPSFATITFSPLIYSGSLE